MRNRRARAWWLSVAALGAVTTASAPSWAWKPYTHVYLAQQAWQDAVDDGRITLYKIDAAGHVVRDGAGKAVVLGTYPVQPRILQALRASPAKYFAGVLGPDAYPDILTGQMRIHPPGPHFEDPAKVPDADKDGPGTDAWLQQIWAKAWQPPFGNDDSIAFATGFLAHAAGDIYAHTFMNTYAGGIFDITDMTNLNWFKHITVEGYVAERTPELAGIPLKGRGAFQPPPLSIFDIVRDDGIKGLERFIAENTWDVRAPNGMPFFPTEGGKNVSVPYHLAKFLETVTQVNKDVTKFDTDLQNEFLHALYNASPIGAAREYAWACGGSECPDPMSTAPTCSAEYPKGDGVCVGMTFGGILGWSTAWAALAAAYGTVYATAHGPAMAIEGWTGNAMATTPTAMQDWVSASHNTAMHLFFSPDHAVHMDSVELNGIPTFSAGYTPFKIDLESIATGLPLGTVQAINTMIEFITAPLDDLKKAIGDAEKWVVDQVFLATFHMTIDQVKECFAKPHLWMNPLLRNNTSGVTGTLQSLNSIMHLPPTAPATCAGATTRCTIAPSLVGTDITGACDIFTDTNIAKFSVDPASPLGVFPAAFNSVNMIKLSLIDPAQVEGLATGLAGKSLGSIFPVMGGAPAPANAMIGFAATIDGSNEWMARRNGAFFDAGQSQMILARDCKAYWGVFLDQRPNYNAQGLLTGAALDAVRPPLIDRLWEPEPMGPCMMQPPPIKKLPPNIVTHFNDTIATSGFGQVTASEPSRFTLASSGTNRHASPLTQGSLVVAPDGLSARYVPPKWNPYGQDQIIVTSKDGARRSVIPVSLEAPRQAMLRRDLTKSPVAAKGDAQGLRAGETAQLVPAGKLPMTWTVVSGPGTVGDAKLEAIHDAKLTANKGKLVASDQLLLTHTPKLTDLKCKGPCQTQAVESVKVAVRARTAAALDVAQTKRQLDDARATYHAPANLTKDEVVTLRGVDAEGNTSLVKVRLLAPPPALQPKLAATTVAPGAHLKLDVDAGLPTTGEADAPPVPMSWAVVSGPGSVGDKTSKEHALHAAKKQEFLAGLEPLNKQLANARPFEVAAARKAWLDYLQSNVPKYAPSFEKLDELERTYHAPAKVVGKQKVTLRGTAQDGSGRTVDMSFDLTP
jgi:hypothetical protein